MASRIGTLFETYRDRFGSNDPGLTERTFVATARQFRSVLLHLVDGVATGTLSLQEFAARSNIALRNAFGSTYLLGALSIDQFHNLTVRDIRIINREIEEERHFLRAFGKDLQRGFYTLDPVSRAGLYLQSLRGMFEMGRLEAIANGPFLWKLGPTEHCGPCFAAALNGPYQKDQFSHLGLPSLPGIPGIGDVCSGLTRCGCTITTVGPLPNTDLQQNIRGLLVEMLNDSS